MLWKLTAPAAMMFAALLPAAPALAAMQAETKPSATIAEAIAEGLQETVGKPDENGFLIVSAKAEGNLLVLLVSGPDGWREGLDRQTVSDTFVDGFCSEAAALFDGRLSMRVDSVDGKVTQTGPLVTSCPAPDA